MLPLSSQAFDDLDFTKPKWIDDDLSLVIMLFRLSHQQDRLGRRQCLQDHAAFGRGYPALRKLPGNIDLSGPLKSVQPAPTLICNRAAIQH